MWKTQASDVGKNSPCYEDDIRAYQSGNTLNSPDGTEIRMGNCPKPGTDPDDKWHGGYDWRFVFCLFALVLVSDVLLPVPQGTDCKVLGFCLFQGTDCQGSWFLCR